MTRAEKVAEAQRLRSTGLLFREIAEQMGVAVSTVDAWINDPDGSRLRARKDSYRGTCADCGGRTDGSNGRDAVPERCGTCNAARESEMTKRWIVDSMKEWAEMYGAPPSAADWNPWHAVNAGMAWKVARYNEAERPWPAVNVVQYHFGTWNAAIEAAGFTPRGIGQYENRGLCARDVEETVALYRSGLTCREVGERLGLSEGAIYQRLVKAGEPRRQRWERAA